MLVGGVYACKQIRTSEASELIQKANDAGDLIALVHFESTVFAIRKLTGIAIGLVRRPDIPKPKSGDCFLDIRIRSDMPKRQVPTIDDFEFYRIDFKGIDYETSSDSTGWPMVIK